MPSTAQPHIQHAQLKDKQEVQLKARRKTYVVSIESEN